MSQPLHHAQTIADAFPPLLVEAERIASSVLTGIHGRRRSGMGENFWQFRRYEQGDPAERIDWRQSARTDKIFVREREWEASQSVYLWADTSGSMQYQSQKNIPLKSERAQILMLALASLLLRGGERVTWLERKPITVHGKTGLQRLAARIMANDQESLPPSIPLARHAHMVLASDFLMSSEEFENLMHHYAAFNLRGVLLHIIDPAEESLPFDGRIEMQGCEGEAPLLLPNAASLRDAYTQRMDEHKARLISYAESAGWFYLRHATSGAPHLALMQLYELLAAEQKAA